jgi:hypothetical protein
LDELNLLLNPYFSPGEMKSGAAATLFINRTGEAQVSANMYTYLTDDPENRVRRIEGLTLKRLDRVSRFVRLARAIGWSFPDLYRAMDAADSSEITPDLIELIARIRALSELTGLPADEVTALWRRIAAGSVRRRLQRSARSARGKPLRGTFRRSVQSVPQSGAGMDH